MDDRSLAALADALACDDERELLDRLRRLLGDGARVTSWRPGRDGWQHHLGDAVQLPVAAVPRDPGCATDGHRQVLRAGHDQTACRVIVLTSPSSDPSTLAAVAELTRVAVGRLVEREAAAAVGQRLTDNERIGQLGSYDWHVPTDTNRWSDQLYRIYGEEPQSFNASYETFLSFIHPDDREHVRQVHEEAFRTGEPYEMEERIVLRDGTERLLWSNGEVITGPDGSPERFIGICRDVTEERAARAAAAEADQHRQEAHDAEVRRRAALELNDTVVQGLTAAAWAQDTGSHEVAATLLSETLERAREMMDDLLVGGGEAPPQAGELRRTAAPPAQLADDSIGRPDHTDLDDAGAGPRRIVLADDAEDVRFLLSMQLEALGMEVVGAAADGQEAVALTAEHRPDLVLLDLSMPRMDGLEAAREIRAQHPDTTIVVLSGHAATTMAQPAHEAGADGYVEKGGDLTRRLERWLGPVPA